MRSEEIIFEIEKDGSTKIAVQGVKGKRCMALTADIEKALGSVKSKTRTADYRRPEQAAANRAQQR